MLMHSKFPIIMVFYALCIESDGGSSQIVILGEAVGGVVAVSVVIMRVKVYRRNKQLIL